MHNPQYPHLRESVCSSAVFKFFKELFRLRGHIRHKFAATNTLSKSAGSQLDIEPASGILMMNIETLERSCC